MKRNRLAGFGIIIASIIFCLTTNAQAQWTTSGNNIYNTNFGNVGIGTTNPGAKLELGGGNIFRITGGGWQEFYNGSVVNGYIGYGANLFSSSGANDFNIRAANALNLGSNGNNIVMTLNTAGNVGIGTMGPTTGKLQVEGYGNGTGIYTTGNGMAIWGSSGSSYGVRGTSFNSIGGYFEGTNSGIALVAMGNVGIGTTSPATPLDVRVSANADELQVGYGVTLGGNGGVEIINKYNNTTQIAGIKLISPATNSGRIAFFTNNAGGGLTEKMRIDEAGNVGIGTTNPGTYKLAVNGTVRVKEIVASTQGWPDFVFDENYQPAQLAELERFVKANKRLPGFPSAKEINANGVKIGEMQAKLLQKVEELTLYVIELKKDNESLRRELSKQDKQ